MSTLQHIWFALIALHLVGYTALAGFDLGAGIWHLAARRGEERRQLLGAIGPFWDGNQVWLVTAGAALFAAFPAVYATVFSGYYLALMLLLVALILRTVAIEFGARKHEPRTQRAWDVTLVACSLVTVVLLGTAFGNILRGLPLDEAGNYTGTFFTLLNPFALLIGLLNLALLAMHGALYLTLKTSGNLAARARRWAQWGWGAALPLTLAVFAAAAVAHPSLRANYLAAPALWILPALTLGGLLLAPVWNARGKAKLAFSASFLAIVGVLATAVAALYPVMVPALGAPAWNLTLANASSSYLTLKTMLVIAAIGLPATYAYIVWAHHLFRGTANGNEHY